MSKAMSNSTPDDACAVSGCRFLVVLVWLCVGVSGLVSQEDCMELFDTYNQGVYVCRSHPDLVTALQIAEAVGRDECQRAFERERWNCSSFSILKAPNITNRVTKEAAYVHALTLAAIAHSVAKVCALGEASSCSCEGEQQLDLPERDGDTQYEMGCSDNVDFGVTFATQFLIRRHIGSGLRQDIETHNMRIAAGVVRKAISWQAKSCKCIGVSGTCTVQSCTNYFPELSVVAQHLLRVYRNYTYHTSTDLSSQHSEEAPSIITNIPDTTTEDKDNYLLYLSDSPDYCVRNEALGSLGTVGRECDPHTTGANSCDKLCTQCGRGHKMVTHTYYETCNCSFEFCCDIHCHRCSRTKNIYICV